MPSEIQAVYGMQPYWNVKSLRAWLKENKLRPIKSVRFEGREIRYRIRPPFKYKRFITKALPGHLYLVIGYFGNSA